MRTLVIGLDGASPRLIDKWIEELPTFKMFKEEGVWGLSIPPLPAQTPVAWTTFMTGKNPGKHGIFSFVMRRQGTYERRIINPNMIDSKTLWRVLSENGKKVGVVNVPMTAVEELKGFMIPGFLSRNEGVPHPLYVKNKLKRKFGEKAVEIVGDVETSFLEMVKKDPNSFFKRINEITDDLSEISLYLFKEEAWDFFMVVFLGTDRIQHFFWKYVDERHPEYEENEYGVKVKQHYKKMDQIIARFLSEKPKDTVTILLSDHGFCPVQKEVLVNDLFREHGIINVKDEKIDLEKSLAVSHGYGDVWLNVKDREPQGVIERGNEYEDVRSEITHILENLKFGAKKPVKKVERREDVYWGPHVREAPDLTIVFHEGWQAARGSEIVKRPGEKGYVVDSQRWNGGHDGTHDPVDVPGLLAMIGPGVERKQSFEAFLYQLMPTILSLHGIPIPQGVDGDPIKYL